MVERIATVDWRGIAAALDAHGCALVKALVSPEACAALAASYEIEDAFRSRIVMARHGFGSGEYKYFAYPLPPIIAALRPALYRALAPIANRWHDTMGIATRFPAAHVDFIKRCHEAAQNRPTPLLLRYRAAYYN